MILLKKTISVLIIFSIIFCFAGCKDKTDTSAPTVSQTVPLSETLVEKVSGEKTFTAENGKVSYTYTYDMPRVTAKTHPANDLTAQNIQEIYDSAEHYASINVENAAKFMEMNSSGAGWKTTISYEIKYCTENYVSFLFTEHRSPSAVPFCYGRTYNLETGNKCSVLDFSIATNTTRISTETLDVFYYNAFAFFRDDGEPLNGDQAELYKQKFELSDYYIDDESLVFFMRKSAVDQSLQSEGYFFNSIPWNMISYELVKPE